MKEDLRHAIERSSSDPERQFLVREYLQARILGFLQEAGAMIPLAFCGGTALRFLYSIPRFSEDLDFSLVKSEKTFDLYDILDRVIKGFTREGYDLELKSSDRSAVESAFVRFPGLLFELGLSGRKEQILSIKIEVDTNPPSGAVLETSIIRRHLFLHLQHHDRASLLAGKLHAILERKYAKGRDYYDLLWYLSDPSWPTPNMTLLRNALLKTGWTQDQVHELNLANKLSERFRNTDWRIVRRDVAPFLKRNEEVEFLNEVDMTKLLSRI